MDTDINLAHQGGVAVLAVFALDWLKRANWFPWLTKDTEKLNRIVSLIIAFGTAAGFKVLSGDYEHGWVLAVPPLGVIIDTLTHAGVQFGGQEILHKLLGNHVLTKQLLAEVVKLNENVKPAGRPGEGQLGA